MKRVKVKCTNPTCLVQGDQKSESGKCGICRTSNLIEGVIEDEDDNSLHSK